MEYRRAFCQAASDIESAGSVAALAGAWKNHAGTIASLSETDKDAIIALKDGRKAELEAS